jgi:hypothetical protein
MSRILPLVVGLALVASCSQDPLQQPIVIDRAAAPSVHQPAVDFALPSATSTTTRCAAETNLFDQLWVAYGSCGSDSDCAGFGKCSGGKCGSCGSDSDCNGHGKCSGGKCGSCGSDSDCKEGKCSNGKCGSCGSDSDCKGNGKCSGGVCGSCGSDSDCNVGKCSNSKCGSCGSDSDCKGGKCSSGRCSNAH